MTKSQLISLVSEKTGLSKVQTGKAINATFETIQDEMASGRRFAMIGFGTFRAVVRKARSGRNPRTGEKMVIPGKLVAKFTPGKTLKESLNSIDSISKWVKK
ncbi:HU family DNA-binding protein [bacterium]|nr:HU family DNA-binding protein [bacterium]